MISFITSFDVHVLDALYTYRDLATAKVFVGISELGSALFICGLVACLGLFLVLRRRYAYLAGLFVSVAGAAGATLILKELVARSRPDIVYQAYLETGYSFPSAHAALAGAFYGFCIYLTWRMIPSQPWRIAGAVFLGALIIVIAFSRIYLGVHYLSDVVAGLILGGLFAFLGARVAEKIRVRHSE